MLRILEEKFRCKFLEKCTVPQNPCTIIITHKTLTKVVSILDTIGYKMQGADHKKVSTIISAKFFRIHSSTYNNLCLILRDNKLRNNKRVSWCAQCSATNICYSPNYPRHKLVRDRFVGFTP